MSLVFFFDDLITAPTEPVVADQTLSFGALTLSGAGGVIPRNTGNAITSASIDSGDPNSHWSIASDGTITPTAAGVSASFSGAPYSLGCTFTNANGSDTATITITIESDTYSHAPADSWSSLLTDIGTASGGPVAVKLRDGNHGDMGTVNNQFANLVTFSSYNFPSPITHYKDRTGEATIESVLLDGVTNIKFENVKFFIAQETPTTDNSTTGIITVSGTWDGITMFRCDVGSSAIEISGNGNNWRRGIASSGVDKGKNLTIQECYFHDLSRGSVLPIDDTTTANTNLLELCVYEDCYQFGPQFAGGSNITARWNVLRKAFSSPSDPSGAHQSWMPYTPSQNASPENIDIYGNVCGPMPYRQDVGSMAGLKLDDLDGTGGLQYIDCHIHGNIAVGTQNIFIEMSNGGSGSTINNNTVLYDRDFLAQSNTDNPGVFLTGDVVSEAVVQANFGAGVPSTASPDTDGVRTSGSADNSNADASLNILYGKISDGDEDADPTYEATFDGPFTSVESMLVSFNPKAGSVMNDTATYPPYGNGASPGYITWPDRFEALPQAGTLIGEFPEAAAAGGIVTGPLIAAMKNHRIRRGLYH